MTKQTIESLKSQVAELESNLSAARNARDHARTQAHEWADKYSKIEVASREERNEMRKTIDALARGKADAETIYDQHRQAVLHYFIVSSNPETAKDASSLAELQARICNTVPPRRTEPNSEYPYGIRGINNC